MNASHDSRMISPITHSTNVETWDEFPPQAIIDAYQKQLGLDVRRLMPTEGPVRVGRCRDSGFRFFWPPTSVGDETFYQDLAAVFPHSNSVRWEHKSALRHLRPGMKVLEVGCGPGVFLGELKALGAEGTGLELNSKIAGIARAKGLRVEHQLLDEHSSAHAGAYDAVCFFQVLEHVADVKPFLEAALQAIRPGGLLIIGVPNNNPWLYQHDRMHTLNLPPHHMGLWDSAALQALPAQFGMDTVAISVEPMLFARQQIKVLLEHRGLQALAGLVARLPALVDRLLARSIGRFFAGRNLVAIYRKR